MTPGFVFADSGLEDIVIPENVERLAPYCFYGTKIKSITIKSKKLKRPDDLGGYYRLGAMKNKIIRVKVPASKLKDYKEMISTGSNTELRFEPL